MGYRLGLDLGANSIGWGVLTLGADGHPAGLLDMGVRVYPDGRNPKDGSSLATARRLPRSIRRNRDRYLQRRTKLLNALTRHGLMPGDAAGRERVATLDPYPLRAAALHHRLEPHELGRALFHLSQRRGFKSNRKVDRGANEGGLIRDAASATEAALARDGHATVGSWLAERHEKRSGVRVRLAGSGKDVSYEFYPTRAMVEAEFDAIWAAQAAWNPALIETARTEIRAAIFDQRLLKPVSVGKCWLELGEDRASRAMPTAQRARIAQTLAHLRVTLPGQPQRSLLDAERHALASLLYQGQDLPLDTVRSRLGWPAEADLNTREEKLVGCATAKVLGSAKRAAGKAWHTLSVAQQDEAVAAILDSESDDAAAARLVALGLSPDGAARAASAMLPDGHAALSLRALGKLLPHLESGLRYSDAVQAAGYPHHSDARTGEVRDRLPYYGELLRERLGTGTGEPGDPEEKRLGRAPNPTVHVALNELRRVVNAIVERHGPPAEIVVESLRDLGRSKTQRQEWEREQRKNRDANDRRRRELAEMNPPLPDNGKNRMRLRLWEEQARRVEDRCCPYTGTLITARMALSDQVEEDHILPFALTLDDSAANRVLVTREANRRKARRTPNDAFGHTAEWHAILERSRLLPPEKRWRFQPDALARFAENGDFLARHLADSATIAQWAVAYLDVLSPGKVRSVPGRLTAMLRRALGLDSKAVLGRGGARKDRTDHRHHAVDAVVVALTDRGLLKRVTDAAKRAEGGGERLLAGVKPPWDEFVADVAARVRALVVSHKPDTGWQAALHNDTAYGPIRGAGQDEPNVVVRRPLDALADWSAEDARSRVRDRVLAGRIAEAAALPDTASRKVALDGVTGSAGNKVRRVRTVERLEPRSVRAIKDRRKEVPYKLVKGDGNHRAEVWRLPSGGVQMRVISTFDAATEAEARRLKHVVLDLRPHPAAKLLMRLHKNDLIAAGTGAERRILRLVKMSEGKLTFAAHNEAGSLKARDADRSDPFKYETLGAVSLLRIAGRKVHVTPDGRVLDSGPWA